MAESNPTSVTIGGYECLRTSVARWTLREGVKPVIEYFDLTPDDARQLAAISGPVDLIITRSNGSKLTVNNLWCLNVEAGPNPYISTVAIADVRWMFSYPIVRRIYNIRRDVGVKRVIDNNQIAQQKGAVTPLVAYLKASLNGSSPWQAVSVVQDVLKLISTGVKGGISFKIDSNIGSIKAVPIEDLTLSDPGDAALNRVLSYLPEAAIYVDYDGTVIVYSRASGREKEIVQALMPEIRDTGHTDLVKNDAIRPIRVDVYFMREVELRIDFIEDESATVTDDHVYMNNVLPLPDYTLTISGNQTTQGSWTKIGAALFTAWGNLPFLGTQAPVSHTLLQRVLVPHKDLWAALQLSGNLPDPDSALSNWTTRIGALQGNYRQTFQIDSLINDRVMSWRAYRIATVDPQTRQRAPAQAYGDYCVLPTQRFLMRQVLQGSSGGSLPFAINQSAYPEDGIIGPNAKPSPAEVSVVDSNQGIVRVDYKLDPFRQWEMILPSQLALGAMPTGNLRRTDLPITFDSVVRANQKVRLSPNFKLAIILTGVPVAANKDQLHKISVYPFEVSGMLPAAAQAGLADAQGPVMEVFIGASTEVARVQWVDSRRTDILKTLGIGEGAPNLTGLVLNQGNAGGAVGASLNRIALARAASIYASLCDRYEGSMTGDMQPDVHLNGWATELVQEVGVKGETITKVLLPPQIPQISLFAFLDSSSRAAILGTVQPEA